MSKIKSRDTKPEILFRSKLWNRGVRFTLKNRVFGKPDIAIKKYRIAIFIDGDFWHGNNWKIRKLKSFEDELETYKLFWRNKIQRNVLRDKIVNKSLREAGWFVLRIWVSSLNRNPDKCIERTISILRKRGCGV